jgi:death on curing protein
MKEPIWIDLADCLSFQEEMLSRFGGLAGIRDERLLDSALNRPQQLFAYGQPSLFDLAAAYASGIIRNHPFLDGNKRAGFMAAALFLEINGLMFLAPEEEVVIQTLTLASGKLKEAEYALWLKDSCKRRRKPPKQSAS